jgi:pimeloyl-ACP methyl ester carboxylesterase
VHQRIDHVTTASGAEIAYASVGEGRPVVYVGGWLGHLELSWSAPLERAFFEELGRGCRLIRYDRAGTGLSSSSSASFTLESELEQLAAVVGTLGDEPFDLIGVSLGALVAVGWAASHPGTVRRLVLYGGWVAGRDVSPASAREHVLGLVASHWGLGSDVLTDIFAPDSDAASRAEYGRYQRASASASTARSLLALSYELDVRGMLEQIAVPTLIVHRADDRAAPVRQAEALAAGITGAQLVVLPGRSHLPHVGDTHAVVTAIRRFLGVRVAARGRRELTPRQAEVALLVSRGLTNREIGEVLGIQERSAEGHVERICLRLGFRSRAQIAAWYSARNSASTAVD